MKHSLDNRYLNAKIHQHAENDIDKTETSVHIGTITKITPSHIWIDYNSYRHGMVNIKMKYNNEGIESFKSIGQHHAVFVMNRVRFELDPLVEFTFS